jgi:hypothetical protein
MGGAVSFVILGLWVLAFNLLLFRFSVFLKLPRIWTESDENWRAGTGAGRRWQSANDSSRLSASAGSVFSVFV